MKPQWRSITTYVDVDTGEVITKETAQSNYVIVKTHKTVKFDDNGTQPVCTTLYTRECKRANLLF